MTAPFPLPSFHPTSHSIPLFFSLQDLLFPSSSFPLSSFSRPFPGRSTSRGSFRSIGAMPWDCLISPCTTVPDQLVISAQRLQPQPPPTFPNKFSQLLSNHQPNQIPSLHHPNITLNKSQHPKPHYTISYQSQPPSLTSFHIPPSSSKPSPSLSPPLPPYGWASSSQSPDFRSLHEYPLFALLPGS